MVEQESESIGQVGRDESVEAEKSGLDELERARGEGKRYHNEEVSFWWRKAQFCMVLYEEVMVTKEVVNRVWEQTLRSIAKTLSVPGFRKGKAPLQLVAQRYKERVEKEWRRKVVDYVLEVCQSLDTSSAPSERVLVERAIHLLSLDMGAIFSFTFMTRPSIPKIDLDTLTLGERRVSGTVEEAKEIFLQHIQWLHGTVRQVTRKEDRSVGEGMLAKMELTFCGDATHQYLRKLCLPFSSRYMPQWLKEALTGLTVGTCTEFSLLNWTASLYEENNICSEDWQERFISHIIHVFPGQSEKEAMSYLWNISQIEGSPLHLHLSLLEVLDPSPVDLKLAESLGKGSVEELHHSITQALEREKEECLKIAYREQMISLLSDQYAFDLPLELILKEYWALYCNAPHPPSHVLGKSQEEVERQWTYDRVVEAERSARVFFLLTTLQEEHALPPLLEQEADKPPPLPPPTEPLHELIGSMRSENIEEGLSGWDLKLQRLSRGNALWHQTCLDFLISKATIVPSAEAPPLGEGEGSRQFPQLLTKQFDMLKHIFVFPKNVKDEEIPRDTLR